MNYKNKPCAQSATQLANLIRTGEASSEEVVQVHLDRIEEVNPDVNAITVILESPRSKRRIVIVPLKTK